MTKQRNQQLTVTTLRKELNTALRVNNETTKKELHAALNSYHETAKRDLNDRFDHYEKRSLNALSDHEKREEGRHEEIMSEFVNPATLIDRSDEFDHLTRYLAERFKVSIEELIGPKLRPFAS